MVTTRRSEEKKDTESEAVEALSPEVDKKAAKSPVSSPASKIRRRGKRDQEEDAVEQDTEENEEESEKKAPLLDSIDVTNGLNDATEGGNNDIEAKEAMNVDAAPSSPLMKADEGVGPNSTDKLEPSLSAPPHYYPYPPPMHHGYPPPYPHSPMWGYHHGYYPPPQYPMPPPGSSNATVSPYYPAPQAPSGSGQGGTQQQPPPPQYPYPPAAYPYYPGYAPMPPPSGHHPPMSPLMQQPLFSPGPSPYHSSSTPKSGQYQPLSGSTPYFPPSSEFNPKHEAKPPAAKKLKSKGKHYEASTDDFNMISTSPSFQEMEKQSKKKKNKKAGKKKSVQNDNYLDGPLAAEEDAADVEEALSMEYDDYDREHHLHKGCTSVASTATATEDGNNGISPMLLATYVKPRLPTNQDELRRRARKNAQSRARADARKARVDDILVKHESERSAEEQRFIVEYERGRYRKNNRSRSRASDNKERVDLILKKPESERSKIESQFLEQYTLRKQRKNEGDRLRRERLKMLGIDTKKPGGTGIKPSVSARGPLPPALLARAGANPNSKGSSSAGAANAGGGGYYPPTSPSDAVHDPYGMYSPPRHPMSMGPPGYYGYPPPYYHYGPPPPPPVTEDDGNAQNQASSHYRNSFSIYPTDKGPVATASSWATPPRHGELRHQPVVTAGGSKSKVDETTTPATSGSASSGVGAGKTITESAPAVTV